MRAAIVAVHASRNLVPSSAFSAATVAVVAKHRWETSTSRLDAAVGKMRASAAGQPAAGAHGELLVDPVTATVKFRCEDCGFSTSDDRAIAPSKLHYQSVPPDVTQSPRLHTPARPGRYIGM